MNRVVSYLSPTTLTNVETFVRPLSECSPDFRLRWNQALEGARYPHLHQSYEWVALRARFGWEADFIGVASDGEVLAGAAILSKSSPLGHFRIATAPCGPFWRPGHEHLLAPLFDLAREAASRKKILFFRFNVPCSVDEFAGLTGWFPESTRLLPAVWTYWNLPRPQMELDLSGSLDEILSRMHHKTRYRYRAALRRGASVEIGTNQDVAGFGELMAELGRRKRIPTQRTEYFRALLDIFPRDRAVLMVTRAGGRFLGGQILARFGSATYALYAAVARDSEYYPSELLDIAAIEWAKQHGCDRLDLGGTCTGWPPSRHERGYGVYDYKRRLGARARLFAPYLDLVCRPALYQAARLAEEVSLPLLLETGWGKLSVLLERIRMLRTTPVRAALGAAGSGD